LPRLATLPANPVLAKTFLNASLQKPRQAVERLRQSAGAEREYLGATVLFAVGYLKPEAMRYQPQAATLWEQLEQQATPGTTPAQHQLIGEYLQSIQAARERARRFSETPKPVRRKKWKPA
jgi:hypothetical protein